MPAALLLACLTLACQRSPALSYQVSIPEGRPGQLAIALRIKNTSGSALTLRAFAAKEVLRIAELEATGPDGARLRVEPGFDSVTLGRVAVDIPRFGLPGPLPSSVNVRYLVAPGNREGDSHIGYSGRCYGHADGKFAFVTGRNLFLVPLPAEEISDIEVRFLLPDAWSAVTPWRREGDLWRPDVGGELAAEHLVTAAIGMGRFRERSFASRETRHRLAFEDSISAEEEQRVVSLLEKTVVYLREVFGRDLGPEYLTVIVPSAPPGDEIAGEGWATGQGQTLAPMTPNRLQTFAERLIDAYLRHAPYRAEIGRPEEFWLVDAVKHLYSWRAVARAGLIPEAELQRELAVGYLSTFSVRGMERDLEKLYGASGRQQSARETLAPFVLLHLEEELRAASRGSVSLDSVVRRLFGGRRAESLWSALPTVRGGFWEEFRERFVKGNEMAPVERFYALSPTRPEPTPPAGKPVRHLTLLYTGQTTGYLENCGCKTNQSGGVARRATLIDRIRKRDGPVLLLDGGSAFLRPEKQNSLDFLSQEEQKLYLRTLDVMQYDAVALGTTELTFGLDHFRDQTRGLRTPYVSANVGSGGEPILPASVKLSLGGLRVAVIGVFEPPRGRGATHLFEEHASSLEVEDPVQTLRREVPVLSRQAELVVAIGRLSPFTIRRAAELCADLDVVISTEYGAPSRVDHEEQGGEEGGAGHLHREDREGFVGRTLVLYSHLTSYGLSRARLGLDRNGRIASAELDDHWLYEDVPDHPVVRDLLNGFYDRVGKLAAAKESVQPLFSDDPVRLTGRYVGGSKCASCHEAEHAQWLTTRHASAYKTLLDRHRHFQPKCISCHVVAYGTPHGYKLGAPEQTLANVQCEVCHGPGAEHVEGPSPGNISRQVPEKICLECHDPEHSDHFVYAERLPKVRHD